MTGSHSVRMWFQVVAGISSILTLASACSATGHVDGGPPFGPTGGVYELACSKAAGEHDVEVGERKYIPPQLIVHDWPGTEKTVTKTATLTESDFIMGLLAPQRPNTPPLRTTLVMARGGTGKSKLAESISAQSCKSAPVFRVDLNTDIAAHLDEFASGQNPIAVFLARQNKLDTKAGAEAALNQAVGDQLYLVVLDSLDEVPLLQRTSIAASIDDFVLRVSPRARAVVMTRPPVFTSNYGLKTVDGRLELPQLTCAETESALARAMPDREVVFFGVGFETTACTTAAALRASPPPNFSILCSHRRVPPALDALLGLPGVAPEGFLLPGHVIAVAGLAEYRELASRRPIAMAVGGFEPVDLLMALKDLVSQVVEGRPRVGNEYRRVVREAGNPAAIAAIDEVFEARDAAWRGIGTIPASGLGLRAAFAARDAAARFGLAPDPGVADTSPGCRCGDVLLGRLEPEACPLFGRACTPDAPVGPCMVAFEGTCAARYRHRRA